jgi:hypothetical protein
MQILVLIQDLASIFKGYFCRIALYFPEILKLLIYWMAWFKFDGDVSPGIGKGRGSAQSILDFQTSCGLEQLKKSCLADLKPV